MIFSMKHVASPLLMMEFENAAAEKISLQIVYRLETHQQHV